MSRLHEFAETIRIAERGLRPINDEEIASYPEGEIGRLFMGRRFIALKTPPGVSKMVWVFRCATSYPKDSLVVFRRITDAERFYNNLHQSKVPKSQYPAVLCLEKDYGADLDYSADSLPEGAVFKKVYIRTEILGRHLIHLKTMLNGLASRLDQNVIIYQVS